PPLTPHRHPLSLHDALPIFRQHLVFVLRDVELEIHQLRHPLLRGRSAAPRASAPVERNPALLIQRLHPKQEVQRLALRSERLAKDRKSTRLNSSHVKISYAV